MFRRVAGDGHRDALTLMIVKVPRSLRDALLGDWLL
jgi:hypothetical protein